MDTPNEIYFQVILRDKQEQVTGTLESSDDKGITIVTKNEKVTISYNKILGIKTFKVCCE